MFLFYLIMNWLNVYPLKVTLPPSDEDESEFFFLLHTTGTSARQIQSDHKWSFIMKCLKSFT